jgi:short subunit dehydrogenase-like uncharacterized protein
LTQAGPIAVYGATGYTGRLVAREARRRQLDLVLCGRDPERLRALAADLGGDVDVRAATVGDRDALRHALGDCAAVVNCAGPFTRLGEPVVRAAVETGTHYVDTTGEQQFMRLVAERYDDAARAAGVAVVPAMGFDFAPGDLICRLTAEKHEPLRELGIAYAVSGFGATRGTLRSTLELMKGGDVVYEEGEWRPAGAGPLRAHVTFPPPFGRQVVAKYPSGEIVTVPRHTRVRTITSRVAVSGVVPAGRLAPLLPPLMAAFAYALRTPLRTALQAAVAALPEGPTQEARRASRFLVVVRAMGEDGSEGRGIVRGEDVYGLTAAVAVHGAALLAAPGYARSGVLAPAIAFDPTAFLDHLAAHGVRWEVERSGGPERCHRLR